MFPKVRKVICFNKMSGRADVFDRSRVAEYNEEDDILDFKPEEKEQ